MNRRERVRDFWGQMLQFRIPSNPLSRAHIWAAGSYAILQGVGIIWGGDLRWIGPAYAIVRQVPGAPPSWGWVSIALGVVIFVGSLTHRWRIKAVGLLGLSGWSLAFAYGLAAATISNATAGTVGGPAFAYVSVSAAVLVWVDEQPRRARERKSSE